MSDHILRELVPRMRTMSFLEIDGLRVAENFRFDRFSTISGNSSAGMPTKIALSLTVIDLHAPTSPKL